MAKKVLYYLNQFFGQIGGEDQAHIAPMVKDEPVGPAAAFENMLQGEGKVYKTIICGDNFYNENVAEVEEVFAKLLEEETPDLVIAGPAFNAGRYGMACAGVANYFNDKGIPVVTGMYVENPGLDTAKPVSYVVETGDSAAQMRKALPLMANVAKKVFAGEEPKPSEDGYFAQGIRKTVIVDKIGAERAMDMLLKRLKDEEFETELPMPEFDNVEPAKPIEDLSKATIALVTSGGIVPLGNPDHIQSASAQKWGKYNISGLENLEGDYFTIHGGYDPVYANESPDRVVPYDALYQLAEEGVIGGVYDYFYTTTGTGTAVGNSIIFGEEIGKELSEAGVDGVILTST